MNSSFLAISPIDRGYSLECFVYRFFFLFCVYGTHSFMAIVARYFMSADFTSHDICLTSVTIQTCGPFHRVKSNHIKHVRNSVLSGLGISFQNLNLNLLHFDQIISLRSLSINLFLLARLNLGLTEGTVFREREREGERERKRDRERRLFKQFRNQSVGHCAAGVQLFKWCQNLSAGTVLQGCSYLSGVFSYLPSLCCRGAAV